MSVSIVHELPSEAWKEFVRRHPQGNIFHTPEMFEVFTRAEGHDPQLWVAVDGRREPLSLMMPVKVSVGPRWLRPLTTRAVAYGSVLAAPQDEGKGALSQMLRAYRDKAKGRSVFTELRNIADLSGLQPILRDEGFQYEPHLNYLIDLKRPAEEIMDSLHKSARKNVRKARRMGVEIRQVTGREEISLVYDILTQVYQRIQVPLADRSLFEALFDVLHPQGMVTFDLAMVEGQPIGAAVRLLYRDTIYAWYAGTLRQYSEYDAHHLLTWHALEWGAENGFSTFDFGGAGKPDENYGPREYKARFGGELVEYGRNVLIPSKLRLRLSQYGYRLYRRVGHWLGTKPRLARKEPER